jgi:hypothetical protein
MFSNPFHRVWSGKSMSQHIGTAAVVQCHDHVRPRYYRYNRPKVVRRRLLILTAATIEARAVARAWGLKAPGPGRPVCSTDSALCVEIHLCGVGLPLPPDHISDLPICGIIMAGVAGALDPTLKVGDIVADGSFASKLAPGLAHLGRIIESDRIISSPAMKKDIFEQTGALAVDMESDRAKAIAGQFGVPYLGLRAISDAAADTLDPEVLQFVDSFGRVKPLSLAWRLVQRPVLIPRLIRLGQASAFAVNRLGPAVRAAADNWAVTPNAM